jgi:hypothetical protein
MARLVTQSDLARLTGRSRQSISKAVAHRLKGALVGARVNIDHDSVRDYLVRAGVDPTMVALPAAAPASEPTAQRPSTNPLLPLPSNPPANDAAPPAPDLPAEPLASNDEAAHRDTRADDIERYAHMTLDQLMRKFGTATAFADWLAARKRISDIREKDLKNDERSGRLIPRELVRTHVFSHIEQSTRRLLQDAATTIARRVYAAAKAGLPVEEAENTVREIIGSQLRPVKASAARVLRGGGEG